MLRFCLFLLCTSFLTPIGAQIRILPLGNSITQGRVGFPSYRQSLWQLFQQAGIAVDFVGSLDAPFLCEQEGSDDFDSDHEAHWGYRIDQILSHNGNHQNCIAVSEQGGLQQWLQGYTADIAIVHLGTNDLFQKAWYESSEAVLSTTLIELAEVIKLLRQANPNIHLYLAQLIPVDEASTNELILQYNLSLKNFAWQRQSLSSPLILVDQYTGFDCEKDTYDGVHPNQEGAKKMASKWFQAITSPLSAAARNAQLSQLRTGQQVWIPETLRSATSLQLLDRQGNVQQQYTQIPSRLDVSDLPSGLYYLAFEAEQSLIRKIWL